MKNALCCFLLLVLVFGACFHLPFVAFCCSSLLFLVFEIESILSQKPKQANAFYCSLWLFVARFGFLWMFPFEHRIARCGFLLVRKTKTSNERQKMSKWKPGLRALIFLLKQEPCGHPTSASNVAWIIVNYSSTRVNWTLLALYDRGRVDSRPPIFGKQCFC